MAKTLLDRVGDVLKRDHHIEVSRTAQKVVVYATGAGTWQMELEETDREFRVEVFQTLIPTNLESDEYVRLRQEYWDAGSLENLGRKNWSRVMDTLKDDINWVAWSFAADTMSAEELAEKALVILATKALLFPAKEYPSEST